MKGKQGDGKVRLIVRLREELVHALKVRAAQERTTVSELIRAWVEPWAKPRRTRPGGGR